MAAAMILHSFLHESNININKKKRHCDENDLDCVHSCLLCDILIPQGLRYAFIQHHKSGFAMSGQIQNTIKQFCHCSKRSRIYHRLFEESQNSTSQINEHYSKSYMRYTFPFIKLNTQTFLQRINNSIWFHFTRKPLSTIISAFHYHSQCRELWDHTLFSVARNDGKPRWRGDKIYQYILNKSQKQGLSYNQTLYDIILNNYSKDQIDSFFHIQMKKKHNIDYNTYTYIPVNEKYHERGLYYFGDSVVTYRKSHIASCISENYFGKFVYNEINEAIYDPILSLESSSSSKKSSKLCTLYQNEHNKYYKRLQYFKNDNNINGNKFCNFGLYYETIRYAQCEWLKFFTVHTLAKLISNDIEYYKKKYWLNIELFEFEMSQWQNTDALMKNMDIIADKLNIIDSIENYNKIEKYFLHNDYFDIDATQFNLTRFRNKLIASLYSLSDFSRYNQQHVTFNKYDTKTEGLLLLRYTVIITFVL